MEVAGVEVANIMPIELHALEQCRSEIEWAMVCEMIKKHRHGMYPPNWLDAVLRSGLMARVTRRWCASCG